MPPRRPRAPRLPIALTPLLGRARELDEAMSLLADTRLLTITGAGGSGKTRLALELAHRVQERFDEVAWVDLAPLSDPDLLPQQILDALGVRELAAEDVLQVVIDAVRDRRILFVLDNCEHLVHASAFVVEEILRSCAGAMILTTTREALGVRGEQTWRVPPLSLQDSMLLFEQRARSVLSSFATDGAVEQICRRLDGIPLAIELAAARVNVLSTEEIAARLDDAFRLLSAGSRTLPRHRTIRETIDWSYRLLSPEEQILFRRLAVFAAGFSLDAAEAVAGEDVDVLTQIAALAGKSLVLVEEHRYRLLDTVRQFAVEKLEESGERQLVQDRHARTYLRLVESLEPRLFGGGSDPAALAAIDEEIGNIRAVFDGAPESDVELRMLYALHWYWFARAQFREARRRITAALARTGPADAAVRAKGAVAGGTAATWQGDWSALRPMVDEAVSVLRSADESRPLSMALMLLAIAQAFGEGDHGAAAQTFAEARKHATGTALALVWYWTGLAAQLRGDWPAARESLEEVQRIGVSSGSRTATAHSLTALGHIALREGNREEALRLLREAFPMHSEIDDRWGLTQAVEGIGLALLEARGAEMGTRLLAAASAAWLHLGARPGRDAAFEVEKNERIREALSDDRLRIVLASGAAMSYEAMVDLARVQIAGLGTAAHAALTVNALGPLQILREGEPVEESARSRELLLYLLCHPSGRTKEQIGAALWPEAEPSKLRNNFHVTLHRLRKSLGSAEWIVVDGDTYAIDRSRGVEFDAETFEREAGAAIRARDAQRLARAVELVRGEFFENGGAGEWYLEARDRLHDVYARALEALGRLRTTAGDHSGAADAYQRLVALDDLDEDAAQNLIDSLSRAGDISGARRAWRRLADALKRELGEKPGIPQP